MLNRIILMLALLLSYATARAYDFQAIADRHVLPTYRSLAERTAELDLAARAYCARPSDLALAHLQAGYRGAFLAWQGAQHLRFGPVQYLSREYRFELWPDERGAVGRHLGQLLDDPALQQPDFDISQKSVAVQGFSAMERLLFAGTPPDTTACRLVVAIAANLRDMADGIVGDWSTGDTPYIRYFADPAPGNPLFANKAELAGRLLNSLHTELELIITQKLARPLDKGQEKARGKRAEGWRSQTGLPAIAANLGACHALYRQAFAPELADASPHPQIEAAFAQAGSTLEKLQMPLAEAVADPGQRALVEQLQAELSALKQLLARDLAAALGLSLGFNSLDGD